MIEKIGNREHHNAEILRAVADGRTVQWRPTGSNRTWIDWMDAAHQPPLVSSQYYEWRVKPDVVRYRLALLNGGWRYNTYVAVAADEGEAGRIEKMENFVRWLGPWQEVEL